MIKIQLLKRSLCCYPHIILDYKAELLRLCRVSTEGITVNEMPNYLQLAQHIENASEYLELDVNEHAFLLHRLYTSRWNLIAPEILEFVETFAKAGQAEPS